MESTQYFILYEIEYTNSMFLHITRIQNIGVYPSYEYASNDMNYYNRFKKNCSYYLVDSDGNAEELL